MDTLLRTKKLEALGFDRPKAEGLVLMVKESIDEEVAKKSDLVAVEYELKSEIAAIKSEIKRVEETLELKIVTQSKSLFIKILILSITMAGVVTGILSWVLTMLLKS